MGWPRGGRGAVVAVSAGNSVEVSVCAVPEGSGARFTAPTEVAPMSAKLDADAVSRATRAMCRELYGDEFDLHDHGSQDPEGRASLERAAEAALTAWLDG